MDASAWDARYAATDLVWGSEPNRFVAAELESVAPGSALDVACGEGRNAIWLATRGWHATGVDYSATAVERARTLAVDAGVADRVSFVVADVAADPLPRSPAESGRYDAVVIAYLQLPAGERRTVLQRAADAVAPGGLLVVVGHHAANLAEGFGGPQDARVLFAPEDVVSDLGATPLVVEKAETVRRPVQTAEGERTALDTLVRWRRPAS